MYSCHLDIGFTCMANTVAIGLISSYFTTYKNVATNVITTGLPFAIMVSAPLTQLLIDIYGWRGALLLLCGLNLHYFPAAAVLKPLKQIQTDHYGTTYERLQNEQNGIKGFRYEHIDAFLNSLLDISCLKNGRFLAVVVICLIQGYTFNGWVVYLVSIVQSKGLTAHEAANVATISGLGAFLIRIVLAVVQGKATYYKQLFFLGSVLAVISYGGMYFASSFWLLSLFSLTVGLGYSMMGSQNYNAANATVEKENAVAAVAWINLTHGLGYITSGYVSGKFSGLVKSQVTKILT